MNKKKGLLLLFCLSVVVVLFFTTFSSKTSARIPGNQQVKSVMVTNGDTIWSIAKANYSELDGDFNDYVATIKETNGLSCEELKAGNYILVPYYSAS